MLYRDVCIESLGYELPSNIVTTLSLEERLAQVYERLNLSLGRLEMMTGIHERRLWDKETPPSKTSAIAAEKAIANSKIDKNDIGCLLHTSLSRDFLEPATASLVHDLVGLPLSATVFDISNACLGFINGMVALANMIELGQEKAGIVVASESSRQITETTIGEILNDPNMTRAKLKLSLASLTLGSGAVAAILVHSSLSKCGHRLIGGVTRNASRHNGLCRIENDTYFFEPGAHPTMATNSQGVLKNGLLLASETWKALKKELAWQDSDVERVFTHQVTAIHNSSLFETLKLDRAKSFATVEYLGNIGTVSLPITLALAVEANCLNAGDKIALLGIGSGLSCIMLGAIW
jgi:3-oxoacyl-[acyl-carrier-protein] synthase III